MTARAGECTIGESLRQHSNWRFTVSDRTFIAGVYAAVAAAASLVLAPLLALAYFATPDGAGELETGTVSAWAEPARDAAGSLLTFASTDRVYSTYLQALAVLFPAILVCAWITRTRRPRDGGRLERWAWRVTLTGYALLVTGVLAVALVLVAAAPDAPVTNTIFLALVVPGTLLGTTGSTALGIALLRSGYRPRVTAWLLTLAFPLWIAGSVVLGHNGIGLVPLFAAWAAAARELDRAPAPARRETATAARFG